MTSITLPLLDDLHVHLREGDMLSNVIQETINGGVGRVMAMPNLKNPLTTADKVQEYQNYIKSLNLDLEILYSLYLGQDTTPEEIVKAAKLGVKNVKMYPAGVTTNSNFGVSDITSFYLVFEAMQENDFIFNIHGEVPSDYGRNICVMNAEAKFLPILAEIQKNFPKLKIVLEHMTSAEAVEYVKNCDSEYLAASITVHHLDLVVDDWAGKIHNFCKPVAKFPVDRQALRDIVKSGNPKFFLGSDSAPHMRELKETACGCAGVYTAPYLAPYLADVLERIGCLDRLVDFATVFGAQFYGLEPQKKTFILTKKPTVVDSEIHGVVPFRAEETLSWGIE